MNWSPKSKWILIYCLLGVIFVLSVYVYHPELHKQMIKSYRLLHEPRQLKVFILSYGAYAPLVFVLVQGLQVIVAPIPGGPIEFLGGYLFGAWGGLIYSMIGLTVGSILAFALGKILREWAVEKFVSQDHRRKFEYLFGHEGAILGFLLFLIPMFPKDALCYILGLTPMRFGVFLLISTTGRIPGTLMATFQGAKAFEHQYKALLLMLAISALTVLLSYIYHDRIHQIIKRLKKK
jgi:uncharacterized membrane protein YdjX (TVP38/TMEM64 family)